MKRIALLQHLFLCPLTVIITVPIHAQTYYNQTTEFLRANSVWAFADSAGLDFNSGTAVPIQTALNSMYNGGFGAGEGQASIADPITGSLLFYSDGFRCYNSNHQVMPNGDSLYGNSTGNIFAPGVSTRQGVCIVPVIGDQDKYYLFSLAPVTATSPHGALFYNVVDMNLNGGLGDIILGQKNIPLDTIMLSEAMIAIPGNCNDIWLMVHSYSDLVAPPVYKAYHINSNGINADPVLSAGIIQTAISTMAISPDRNRIVLASLDGAGGAGGIELCKFNPATGMVDSVILLETSPLGSMGCAFSPNNNFLYADDILMPSPYGGAILQYAIDVHDSATINSSKTIIVPGTQTYHYYRLYNDTIYLAGYRDSAISKINNPNVSGTSCDYQRNAVMLLRGTLHQNGLPSEVVYPFQPDSVYSLLADTLICSGWENGLRLNPSEVIEGYSYVWNDASADTMLEIFAAGTYWVSYTNGCSFYVDTFRLNGADLEPPVITINVRELNTTVPYATYQWIVNGNIIPGATNNVYFVTENGDYQVIVSNVEGCVDTSDIYTVTNVTSVVKNTWHDQVTIFPNPATNKVYIQTPISVDIVLSSIEGKTVIQQKNVAQFSVENIAAGIYLLKIMDKDGYLLKTEKLVKQ